MTQADSPERRSIWLKDDVLNLSTHSKNSDSVEHDERFQLANTLITRFECDSDFDTLDKATSLYREGLSQWPAGSFKHRLYCVGLARSLRMRYAYNGDHALLDEAISLGRQAVASIPALAGELFEAFSHIDLATSLKTRFKSTGDKRLLKEAISLEREVLHMLPAVHPGLPLCCTNLGDSLMIQIQYDSVGGDGCLLEAIELNRTALSQSPPGHSHHAQSCSSLAVVLQTRYDSDGDISLLTEAIQLHRKALSLLPEGHIYRAASCANLGVSLKSWYKHTGDEPLLAEAIDLQREALNLRPPGHTERAGSCAILANLLWALYRRVGEPRILAQTIELEREALSLRHTGHPDRALSCSSLAISLWTQYNDIGDDRFLIEAVDLEREALNLRPKGHPGRTMSCGNLGILLWTRYKRIGDDRALVEAIDLEREGLELCPKGHPDRVSLCVNLGVSLQTLYSQTSDDSLIVEAINLQREALALCSQEYLHRPMLYITLANSLWKRYNQIGDDQLLVEAIDAQRTALTLCPKGHPDHGMSCGNLGHLLRMRYQCSGGDDVLAEAVELLKVALSAAPSHKIWKYMLELSWVHLHSDAAFHNVDAAILLIYQSLEREPDVLSEALSCILSLLDSIWTSNMQATQDRALIRIYRRITNVLPLLVNPALDFQSQLHTVSGYSQVGSDAFVNAILAQDHRSGLELLEVVQGAVWSQLLYRRDPQLQLIPPVLAKELEGLLTSLSLRLITSSTFPQIDVSSQDALHDQSSRLYALMREIRALPGMDRFMLGEVYDSLRTVALAHPVVLLVGARGFYYALIMNSSTPGGEFILPLDLEKEDFETSFQMRDWSRSRRGAARSSYTDVKSEQRGVQFKKIISTPLNVYLKRLWVKIVHPVMSALGLKASEGRSRPRLHWCSTGIFSTLPLHAAGIHDGPDAGRICCFDYVVSTYTPTLTTLMRVRSAEITPLAHQDLLVSLVGEEAADDGDLLAIPEVNIELQGISSIAKARNIKVVYQQEGSTTISSTSVAIQAANIVHLACHGIQDDVDATRSGFYLGDGRLTISHLMDLHIKDGFLAFLSACETAKGSKEQPDQAMHLAAAMLFTGFKSVIATIWAIADADGPCMAEWFYEDLFANEAINGDAVAYAIDTAIRKLRDSGVPSDRWAPFIHMGA